MVQLEKAIEEVAQTIGGGHLFCSLQDKSRVVFVKYFDSCIVDLILMLSTSSIVFALKKRTPRTSYNSPFSASTLSFSLFLKAASSRITPRLMCSSSSMLGAGARSSTMACCSSGSCAACSILPIIRSLKSGRASI